MIKNILKHAYEMKWFDSHIYKNLLGDLLEDTYCVKGLQKDSEYGNMEHKSNNFIISKKLITNEIFVKVLNAIQIENVVSGSYLIFNEFNPALPIIYNRNENLYTVSNEYKNHPVCGVNWIGARLIALLLGGRLPTEFEWEICAKSGCEENIYPWGSNEPTSDLANYGENVGGTTAVGLYPPNDWGIYDMAGNVEEWCMDWLNYNKDNCLNNKNLVKYEKVVKGGGWNKGYEFLRCNQRRGKWYRIGTVGIGFRVVWDMN